MESERPSWMQRFPRLTAGGAQWRLPLADHVATELVRILVVESVEGRTEAVAELISIDPAFALWTACMAGRWGGVAPRCVAELAQWFAHRGMGTLRWSPEEPETRPEKNDARARWRELAADAVAIANLAANSTDKDLVAAEAFLFGLLHNALDWLRGSGPRVPLAEAEQSCLPAWLVSQLRQRARGPRCEAVQKVLQARAAWRQAGRRGARVADVELVDVRHVRKWWQGPKGECVQPVATALPTLVQKLTRLEQLEHQFQQTLEQEKLESLGELAYGASHEINNPLANISTRAQTLLRDESDPERRRMLAIINTQAFRATEMIADMMLFARPPRLEKQRTNLVAVVDSVVSELLEEAERQGTLLVRASEADELFTQADATHLAVAIRAVCMNALEALGADGRVELDLRLVGQLPGRTGQWVQLVIADTGPGISSEVRRHMFDPFYSGREAGRGLGLGLSKCWRVVTSHGGHVDVASQLGKGTRLTIRLPVEAETVTEEDTDEIGTRTSANDPPSGEK